MTSEVTVSVRLGPVAFENLAALCYLLDLSPEDALEQALSRATADLGEPLSKKERGRL